MDEGCSIESSVCQAHTLQTAEYRDTSSDHERSQSFHITPSTHARMTKRTKSETYSVPKLMRRD